MAKFQSKSYNSDGGTNVSDNGMAGGNKAQGGSKKIANSGGSLNPGQIQLGTTHGKHDVAHRIGGKSGAHTINHKGNVEV